MAHPVMFDESDPLLQRLRALATALPEVEERVSHGRPTWRLAKQFAVYGGGERSPEGHLRHDHALLFVPEDGEVAGLDADERFFVPAYYGPSGLARGRPGPRRRRLGRGRRAARRLLPDGGQQAAARGARRPLSLLGRRSLPSRCATGNLTRVSHPSQPHRGSTVDPVERRVGPYRVLTRIGEGGMGVVHLAEAPDGRRVALKVLRPHVVGDDEGRERLAREVASLRKVRSGHVAEIIDADPWGELAFIVTRYVPGDSLTELVKREGPVRGADLDHLADHLLAAIRDVHASGVLHRDVKPTNVVMEGRSPVLIDFGLARLAEDPAMTATGILLGTPGYLAPELLLGDQPTGAVDVHGWASTVVFAAQGVSPYGRGHTMAILDRTRRGEFTIDDVPAGLRPLLASALAPDPLERPTTREVAAELERLRGDDRPTTALSIAPPPAPDAPDARTRPRSPGSPRPGSRSATTRRPW